jgi:hypothetical protein
VIAKSGGYESIDDFALQKNFQGSRENMEDQAKKLFKETIESKPETLASITDLTPRDKIPEVDDLFAYLQDQYKTIGNKEELNTISQLFNKKAYTATELDSIRSLADATLPQGAYKGAEPVKTKGLQKVIDNIRRILGDLDESGTLKQQNTDIRILHNLVENLGQSAQRNLANQVLFRTLGRLGAGAGASVAIPGAAPIAAAYAVGGALTDNPAIASTVARVLNKIPSSERSEVTKLINQIVSAVTKNAGTKTTQ